MFGRSGEEIAALQAAGIAVSVVPGITTASALRRRGSTPRSPIAMRRNRCASSPAIRAGVCCRTPSIGGRWPIPPPPTVFYMGGRTAPQIAGRLLGEGMAPDTPVVIAANVSRKDERRWSGPLAAPGAGHGRHRPRRSGGHRASAGCSHAAKPWRHRAPEMAPARPGGVRARPSHCRGRCGRGWRRRASISLFAHVQGREQAEHPGRAAG